MQKRSERKPLPESLLVLIVALCTFVVWASCTQSGFTVDDYLVIDAQSPIRSLADVFAMFWRHDPNPQYWRPVSNASVSLNFFLSGWHGNMFHLANLIFHILATCLVYFFSRRILLFSSLTAFLLALFFGISGAHDANLLWIAARADVLAAIMIMTSLLAAQQALKEGAKQWLWNSISYLALFFALCSKEISGVVVLLLAILVYSNSPKDLWHNKWNIFLKVLPHVAVIFFYIILRSPFTVPLGQMQPLSAEGSHSIAAFAKNVLYSIGYSIAPLDFQLASQMINRYALSGYLLAGTFFAGLIYLLYRYRNSLLQFYKPFALLLITGFVSFQSFERWRVYLPSVAIYAIIILLGSRLWKDRKGLVRTMLSLLLVVIIFFHIFEAYSSQQVWIEATEMTGSMKEDMKIILAKHPDRPINIKFLTSPVKLGSGHLLQLSNSYIAFMADAENKNLPQLQYGKVTIPGDSIEVSSIIDLYALDPKKGFESLQITPHGNREYEISTVAGEIGLFPVNDPNSRKARRDIVLTEGRIDTVGEALVKIEKAEGSFASQVNVKLIDTSALYIYFDGRRITELH